MKPVNLLPGDAPVVSTEPAKPNLGMIGGALAGLVAIVGVSGYFAMARVDSVKSETGAAQARATEATEEAAAVRSQIESLGQPVVDSDRQLAQGAEQVLVSAYTERHDFVRLADDLRAIMEGTDGWYQHVTASSAAGEDGTEVTIVGFMPTKELMATFNERANATKTLKDAVTVGIETVRLIDVANKRPGIYFKFTMTASLVDTVAPSVDGDTGAGATSDGTGTTVGNGSGGDGSINLSLDPEPVEKPRASAAKPAKPAKPKNPFDVAASVAGGGK